MHVGSLSTIGKTYQYEHPYLHLYQSILTVTYGGPSSKEPACQRRFDPWIGKTGGGHGNPLQYSYLENPMDRGAWRATVHGVAQR